MRPLEPAPAGASTGEVISFLEGAHRRYWYYTTERKDGLYVGVITRDREQVEVFASRDFGEAFFHFLSGDFSEGIARVVVPDEKMGHAVFIDKTGREIAPTNIAFASEFSEGLAPSWKNGKVGFVDTTGKFVIAPRFEAAQSFSEELAPVQLNKKRGYVDHRGVLVIPAKFDAQFYMTPSYRFSEGLAPVQLDDEHCGYINTRGKVVIRLRLTGVSEFKGGLAWVNRVVT